MNRYRRAGAALAAGILLAACGSAQRGETPPAEGSAERPAEAAAAAPAPKRQERRPPPGGAWVIFGSDTVVAEVARTADEKAQGLMYREAVPDGTGMLFVYDESEIRSFWMNNTYVALDIAFMDASLRIIDIQQMEPQTTTPHESPAPFMFGLEVRRGWFAEKGIEAGDEAVIEFGVALGGR